MSNEVTVYTLPNCVQCNQTKKQLDKLGIPYDTVDLTENEEAYRFVTETLGYKSAPVVIVTGNVEKKDHEGDMLQLNQIINHWNGFQPEQINDLKK